VFTLRQYSDDILKGTQIVGPQVEVPAGRYLIGKVEDGKKDHRDPKFRSGVGGVKKEEEYSQVGGKQQFEGRARWGEGKTSTTYLS